MTQQEQSISQPAKVDKRGGARKGCGRKPIDPNEYKIQVFFYVKRKNVDAFRAAVEKLLKKYNR